MTHATNPTPENLPPIDYRGMHVITTDLLARCYGTGAKNIHDNFADQADRFAEGKHFFRLEGDVLRAFKNYPENFGVVDKRARHLILWTERGAARHAKMLDTDQAWEVFEKLEDSYFRKSEDLLAQHEALFPAPRVTTVREHQRRVSTSRDTLNSMAKLVDRLAAYVDRLPHDAPPLITAPPPDIKHGQAHIELNGEILTIDTRVGSLTPGVDALVAVGASLDIVRLLRPYESAIWPGTLTRTWFFRRPEFNSEVKVTAIGRLISRRPMPVER